MKKEEKDYLKIVKHSNGYDDYDEIEEELLELELSQKQFKILNKELKKKDTIIRKLENKIDKLEERILKVKEQRARKIHNVVKINKRSKPKKQILSDELVEDKDKLKRWRKYLSRIENNLEFNKTYTMADIMREFFIPRYVFDWAINNLIEREIVGTRITTVGVRYYKK